MGWLFSFAWMTDIHVGRPDTYLNNDVAPYIAPLNNAALSFVVVSGDLTDHSTEAEHIDYADKVIGTLNAPHYAVPGNHDRGAGKDSSGQTADGEDDYSMFYQYIQASEHFVADSHDVRVIGLCSKMNCLGQYQSITAAELSWFETRLQEAAGKRVLVFTHFPAIEITPGYHDWTIVDNLGGSAFKALCEQYGVLAVMSGHKHFPFESAVLNGVRYLNGPSRAWQYNSTPTGYTLIDVFDGSIVFYFYSSPTTQADVLTI